jgi:RHH-type proline utilization regulon transcriptional repressor/proline dehydrogenase/delta 1-pyrroline-5-carboxylate dehydrogenase
VDWDKLAEAAVVQAAAWQDRANQLLTAEEKGIQEQMKRLLTNPLDKAVLTRMIDQSFRSHDHNRVADQVNNLLREYGVPDFFSKVDRLLIQMFLGLGRFFPTVSVPKMIEHMRNSSSRAIIPGEPDQLLAHLQKRKRQGVRMNINHLGEALLGEKEARRRLDTYIRDLRNPEIEYISIKISTIYSQISSLAFEHTLEVLTGRLEELYRTARDNYFIRHDGTRVPKFVNLDMEEYRDLRITAQAFVRTLDRKEFLDYSAGLVLQAYLPDSFAMQQELTAWAKDRVSRGGAPIRLRLVKGANMEMELVESSLMNWPLALYDQKLEVDANYKRMVEYGLRPENAPAAHLGIASHNLFELALAGELAKARQVTDYYYFEMLEGMADHMRRALSEMSGEVLLYAPVAAKEEFINAIAYLIRRLDENTAGENFLRYAPGLRTDSPEWQHLEEQFRASLKLMDRVGSEPHRIQDRRAEQFPEQLGTFHENEFRNEADTDWSLAGNQAWAEGIREKWLRGPDDPWLDIPVVVADHEVFEGRDKREIVDLSRINAKTGQRPVLGRAALADASDVDKAVAVARTDPDKWRVRDPEERHLILSRVAMEIRRSRGDLIGAAAAGTGKVFTEADVEVSEAVDFAEFYPHSVRLFAQRPNINFRGLGVGLVISPWNFPIAIPCGGLAASLAAGNTVIFKPASAAILPAWILCQCFWRAGVSRNVLQFLPCVGSGPGAHLANHPDVDYIILTGGTETGLAILNQRPDAVLCAETGGKNATIVTALSDRDQAVKNVVASAFGNSGQKCSATSLLILEKEVYEDENFRQQLVDAAGSFRTGSVWDFENRMGPLISPPTGDLLKALTRLEPGESFALEPENINDNPQMWTPGIKWGVQPGSYTHLTEFFGPVLGVMAAGSLGEAIDLANQTGYGLTSGLESLDRREQKQWKEGIKAGNLYINRGTTGAVVLRQPFGGLGKSALGPGIKVGGSNYVYQFMAFEETGPPPIGALAADHVLLRLVREWDLKLAWGQMAEYRADLKKTVRAVKSYLFWMEQEFSREKDYFHLRGQDNHLRYLPVGRVVVRLHSDDSLFEVLARTAAGRLAGCQVEVSLPPESANRVTDFLASPLAAGFMDGVPQVSETDRNLAERMALVQRIRYASPDRVPPLLYREAARLGLYISRRKVFMEGRLELLQYFREQSICDNYHRYGNLGDRAVLPDLTTKSRCLP